jgi:hypothetical protein
LLAIAPTDSSSAAPVAHSYASGTVIPPGKPLHLSPSVAAFRARSSSPKAGEAVFVIQAPDGLIPTDGSSVNWSVVDENGQRVNFS